MLKVADSHVVTRAALADLVLPACFCAVGAPYSSIADCVLVEALLMVCLHNLFLQTVSVGQLLPS